MGLLDSIGSVLTNPEVEMLLPAALGALGGGLTSPRLAGSRGAIGSALMGGAQGLERGMTVAQNQPLAQAQIQEAQMRTKYLEMQNKQMQLQTTNDELWNKSIDKYAAALPADQRDQFTMLAKGADKAQRLEAVKYFTQIQALPQTYKTLSAMTGKPEDSFHGLEPEESHALLLKVMEAAAEGRKPQLIDGTDGYSMITVDPDNPSKQKVTPLFQGDGKSRLMGRDKTMPFAFGVDAAGNIAAENKKTGTVADTGVGAAPKAGRIEKGADGFYHSIDPVTGKDIKTAVKAPATAASGFRLVTGEDGYFHKINLATGEDTKLLKAPEKNSHLVQGDDGKYHIVHADGSSTATDVGGVAKGAVTEAGAMAGMQTEYDKRRTANDIVTAKNAMFNDPETGKPIPGMPIAPLPNPGLPRTFQEWANSKDGQAFKQARLGHAPSAAPSAASTVAPSSSPTPAAKPTSPAAKAAPKTTPAPTIDVPGFGKGDLAGYKKGPDGKPLYDHPLYKVPGHDGYYSPGG